jgi:hypothetical protein
MLEGSAYWPPCAGNLLERSDDMGLYAIFTGRVMLERRLPRMKCPGIRIPDLFSNVLCHGGRVEYVSQYCEKSLISAKMPIEPKVSTWVAKWTQTATVWVQSSTHTKSMDKNRPKLSAVGLPFFAADSKKHLRFKSNSKAAAVGMPL